jgi:hypothetical protein
VEEERIVAVILMSTDQKSDPPSRQQIAAILVSCASRARAWIPILAEDLRNQLGVAAPLVTMTNMGLAQTTSLPERIERRIINSTKDFGRFVDISSLPLDSLSYHPDVIIDTTGQADPRAFTVPILRWMLNGNNAEDAVVCALWSDKPPQLGLQLITPRGSKTLSASRIFVPDREMTTRALDSIFRRLVPLLVDAIAHILGSRPLPTLTEEIDSQIAAASGKDVLRQTVHGYLPKIARQFLKPLLRRNDWCIGYRRREPEDFPIDLDLRPETFTLLSSPPSRFYADPFLFEKDETTFLFFEDYDYAVGTAHISYVTLGTHEASAPTLALERPYHLSYPYVFAHDRRILMIPETAYNRTIELYEAKSFPNEWRLCSVLATNILALDATVCWREGRWWMFATVMLEHDNSSSDTLSIFWADAVEGPWHRHHLNPVKYDVRSSRPAGTLIESEGRLLRPAQDCSKGYGSALTWCEVVALSETSFAERLIARQACPAGSRYCGLHTYNRTATFEVADFARTNRR